MTSTVLRGSAVRCALAALAVATLPNVSAAQDARTAEQVIERYVTAIGGRDAVMNATSSRTTARMELPAMGMAGTMEVLVASPGNMLQRMTLSGFGESQAGVVDGRAWSIDPMQGARIVTGPEAEQSSHATDPTVTLRDAKHFTSREIVDEREFDGDRCTAVRFVWTSGRETTDCFSIESGLLIASQSTMESPMGSADVVTRALEYKEFGGIRVPTLLRQSLMGMEQVITIETIEYGNVSAADIAPPAAIRTLLDQAS